jgi:hypothetical protein
VKKDNSEEISRDRDERRNKIEDSRQKIRREEEDKKKKEDKKREERK